MIQEKYCYRKANAIERKRFEKIISAITDVILTMVKDGVMALPSDLSKNAKKSIYKHIDIETVNKKDAFKRYRYDNVLSVKDIFLECLPNKDNKELFKKAIKSITVVNNADMKNQKIKFILHRKIFDKIEREDKYHLVEDVLFFEKVINRNNNKFLKLLPQSLIERRKIIAMIERKTKVPEKAIYRDKNELPRNTSR